jgi:exosome complex component RRP46
LSSVTGPVEVRLREELVDRSTLEFNLTPLTTSSTGGGGPRTKQLEQTIRNLFTPLILTQFYPRSLIQINSQTISNPSNQYSKPFSTTLNDNDNDSITTRRRNNNLAIGGASEQAARINSITLALLDAGVQLRGLLIAVAVAFIPTSREEGHEEEEIDIILDPTVEEEELAKSSHVSTISFGQSIGGGTLGEIVGTESTGRFTSDELFRAQDLSLKASQTILGFVRKSVEAKYGVQSQSHPPTPKDGGGGGKEIKMCVAEDGREMSDPEEDQAMI